MIKRTLLFVLLLAEPPSILAQPQDAASVLTSLVRITAAREGSRVRGSGFVVERTGDLVKVVTASHVIEGATFQVKFPSSVGRFKAETVLGLESSDPHGLAAFLVRGVPARVTALSLDLELRPQPAESLLLAGFLQRSPTALVKQRVLSGRQGKLLQIDQPVGEGFSGGPVVRNGKVVGVVTGEDRQLTYAVNAFVIQEALLGWPVDLEAPLPPTSILACLSGEEEKVDHGITFVRICAGAFTLGSADDDPRSVHREKPAHEVTLSEYWIGKTEVTNEQYRQLHSDHEGAADHPAVQVSWFDAKSFCESRGFQLPTEAQWEHAARAGVQEAWSFGDDESVLGEYAWYGEPVTQSAHPVGQKKANPWGLYDLHGNVWEWVADWHGSYSSGLQADPVGPSDGQFRVLRGGSYASSPEGVRSAVRFRLRPEERFGDIGFRCVLGADRP